MTKRPGAGRKPPDDGGRAGSGSLEQAREACRRLRWAVAFDAYSQAEQDAPLSAEDLELLATAAYLIGRVEDCLRALQQAHQAHAKAGDPRRAVRCVFWLGFILLLQGEVAQAGGWLARAQRLLQDEKQECAEHGLVLLPAVLQAEAAGDFTTAQDIASRAASIGSRAGDADVLSLALHFGGRAQLKAGRVRDGIAMLDESMVAVVAGELAPYVAGSVYCSMIDACREISELRRASEWTDALTAWCDTQPEMITFSGQCLTHRAEIMQLRGDWSDAVEEAQRACDRLARSADRGATGAARYRLAEIYRAQGEFTLAEEAYREAGEWGHDPQPGLALLRLARGEVDVARAAIDRAVAETTDLPRRARLLPAQVEIALAAGDAEAARAAASELAEIAATYDTAAVGAEADHARGAVQLAGGDAREALVTLRSAWQTWLELRVPYEAARVRVLVGMACRMLGDADSSTLELDSARRVFSQLGAAPELARVDSLLREMSPSADHRLSDRELQVLRLLAAGKTNRAIAADLVLAEKTIDRHVSNIYGKLEVSSRAAATAYAYEHRLVHGGDAR